MSALKIQKWLERLLSVNLYLSFTPRKKNKWVPMGKTYFFYPTYMRFVEWIIIEGSDDKNCSGVAKQNTHRAFSFPCAKAEPSNQPSGLKGNTVNRNTSSFCGVEELSDIIPIIPKPGFSINVATCWVFLLRFNGVWIWIYDHLQKDCKWGQAQIFSLPT